MSGVLQAMGVDEPTGFGTLRLSVGRYESVGGKRIIPVARKRLARLSFFGRDAKYCFGRSKVRTYRWWTSLHVVGVRIPAVGAVVQEHRCDRLKNV